MCDHSCSNKTTKTEGQSISQSVPPSALNEKLWKVYLKRMIGVVMKLWDLADRWHSRSREKSGKWFGTGLVFA
jgi:hypothetical protein